MIFSIEKIYNICVLFSIQIKFHHIQIIVDLILKIEKY